MKRCAVLTLLLCVMLALPCLGAFDPDSGLVQGEGFFLRLPTGWTLDTDAGVYQLYVSPDYPADTGNLTVALSGKDEGFSYYTQESFELLYGELFEDLTFHSFAKTLAYGVEGYRLDYRVVIDMMELRQVQYLFNLPDGSLTLTFTEAEQPMDHIIEEVMATLEIQGVDDDGAAIDRDQETRAPDSFSSRLAGKLGARREKLRA